MNILPENWKKVKLGDILKVSSGKSLKMNVLKEGNYPVYGGNGINGYHSEYLFSEKKLIIGRVGAKCGITHITKGKSWVTDNALVVSPIFPVYNLQFMQMRLNFENLNKLSVSTAQPVISGSNIYTCEISLPSLAEQHRIVAKIEELFSDLDDGIASLKKVKEQLKTYRQSVLKWAFEGKLTEEWRKKNKPEPASELLKRIREEREKTYKEECAKAKKEGTRPPKKIEELPPVSEGELSELPELPKGWEYSRLTDITEIKGGLTKDSKKVGKDRKEVPYLRVANVQRGYIDLSEVKEIFATDEEINNLKLQKGDILFNEGGDRDKLGRGWIWNEELPVCIHQNHVFRARLYSKNIEPKLISHFGNTFGQKYFINEGTQTTNLASINLTKLSNFPIPIIPFSEQIEILSEIESRISEADNLEKTIDESLSKADALRQSILKQAFEGKLVPQDPNDEPAAKLLERIKQEKKRDETQMPAKAKSKRNS
jgi:type I restriction enzyme S subunit